MSKKERVKTMISTLRTAIFVFISALFGMFAFGLMNYKLLMSDTIILCGVITGIVIVMIALVVLVRWFFKELKRLEKMK